MKRCYSVYVIQVIIHININIELELGEISDCPIDFEEVHNRYKRKYGKNPLEIAEKTQKHTGFSFLKSASRASTVFEYAYNVFSQDHPLVEGVYQEQVFLYKYFYIIYTKRENNLILFQMNH